MDEYQTQHFWKMDKIKCYELDFCDTNLITQNINDITAWIASEIHDLEDGDELQYTINVKMLSQQEIDSLPEWS